MVILDILLKDTLENQHNKQTQQGPEHNISVTNNISSFNLKYHTSASESCS